MPIYLHDRYDKKIQEAFVKESVIKGLLANDYDFSGVKTVKISTLQTVPMNDYQRTGTNRYGTPVGNGGYRAGAHDDAGQGLCDHD